MDSFYLDSLCKIGHFKYLRLALHCQIVFGVTRVTLTLLNAESHKGFEQSIRFSADVHWTLTIIS